MPTDAQTLLDDLLKQTPLLNLGFRREPMPIYQCCFLGEDNQPVRTEVLSARDELGARREAMNLMMRVGRFSGYELWAEGRVITEYRPAKASITSGR
jgi:hypothetical protein